MELNIRINLDKDTFNTSVKMEELRRCLSKIVYHFERNGGEFMIFDTNGDRVGEAFIK